jgi:hypothetical protein
MYQGHFLQGRSPGRSLLDSTCAGSSAAATSDLWPSWEGSLPGQVCLEWSALSSVQDCFTTLVFMKALLEMPLVAEETFFF